ncbi:phage holin [bacterium]|nr:phage holin [bacterium]
MGGVVMKVSKGTIIRTALLVLAIVNNLLALFNKSPLPIEDDTIEAVISFLFTTGTAIVAWWKNNSFTSAALAGDEVMKQLKARGQ